MARREDDGKPDSRQLQTDHGRLLTELALKRAESYPNHPPRPTHQPPTSKHGDN